MKIYSHPSLFPFGEVMLAVLENIPEKIETLAEKAMRYFRPGAERPFEDPAELIRWCLFGATHFSFVRFLSEVLGEGGLLVSNAALGILDADPYEAFVLSLQPPDKFFPALFKSSEWRIRKGGRLIEVIPFGDSIVEVRERTVRTCLEGIQRDLADLKNCGFWPYESPARCSTEQVIVDSLAAAEDAVGRAYAAFRSLRRGDTCSGAPSVSAVKIYEQDK